MIVNVILKHNKIILVCITLTYNKLIIVHLQIGTKEDIGVKFRYLSVLIFIVNLNMHCSNSPVWLSAP